MKILNAHCASGNSREHTYLSVRSLFLALACLQVLRQSCVALRDVFECN
jgi:hypothetical protein